MEILDEGGPGPVFRVTPQDCPERPVEATTATAAWIAVINKVNRIHGKTSKVGAIPNTAIPLLLTASCYTMACREPGSQ